MVALSKNRRNALLLSPLILFPLLILAALFWFRQSSLKQAVAAPAIYEAKASPALAAQIGLPIESGWPIRGTVTAHKGHGSADLEIPLTGSHGKGVLLAWAQQRRGKWRLCSLSFHLDSGQTLTILDAARNAVKDTTMPRCEPE